MSKLDEVKEHIGALKTYLGLLVAIMLGVGAGVSKLYLDSNFNILFWFGSLIVFACIVLFVIIARSMHKNIKKLEKL